MEWTNSRNILNLELLDEIEQKFSVIIPKDYREFIAVNNAGIPSFNKFDSEDKTYYFERLISINRKDNPNVLTSINWVEQKEDCLLIPVALDYDSNMISLKIIGSEFCVVLIDYENGEEYFLAKNWNDFLLMLHG